MLGNENTIRVNQQYFNTAGDLLYAKGVIFVFRKQLSATEFALLILLVGRTYARGVRPVTDKAVRWSLGTLSSVVPRTFGSPQSCKMKNIWEPTSNATEYLYKNTTFTIPARNSVFLLLSDLCLST